MKKMKVWSWIFLWVMLMVMTSLVSSGIVPSNITRSLLNTSGRFPREKHPACLKEELEKDPDKCCEWCPKGYRLIKEQRPNCGEGVGRCTPCTGHTYTVTVNQVNKCKRCDSCDKEASKETAEECTSHQNTKCKCKKGYYKVSTLGSEFNCEECKKCEQRNKTAHCFDTQDTQCGPCYPGYYEDENDKCRQCEKKDFLKPACKHLITTTTLPTPSTFSASTTPTTSSPAGSLVIFLCLMVVLMSVGFLCYLLHLCARCGTVLSPWTLGKTPKQSYQIYPVRDALQRRTSSSLPDCISEDNNDILTVIPSLQMDNLQCMSFTPTETLVTTVQCGPATPLLMDSDPKTLRDDPKVEGWPAVVLYTVIGEVPVRRWKEFLRLLCVPDSQMERVEMEAGPCYLEQQYQMLRLWSQRGGVALEDVYSVLQSMNLSGCAHELQEKLEKLQQQMGTPLPPEKAV
ncbi:hypothetical protein AGOR_G00134510 [Albula goreensis]|uniref:Tumor necrosis factor receptor superfamily member 1A-like n=1 Tax=Albula goreensis TaxID=1534307 RepID=A0A8T3DA97_9TELE|nr:hypothetical protein AGOR_G00134510 [Albula goreensis]